MRYQPQKQFQFNNPGVRKEKSEHGGSLKNPQKRKRPLGLRTTTHIVLRSTKAKKKWSFKKFETQIQSIITNFSKKYHIQVLSSANVGNHIHLHLKLPNRKSYCSFIRAISSAIMMKVTGYNRWHKPPNDFQFWDRRPFSRIVSTWTEFLNLKKYIQVNMWEGLGVNRHAARQLVSNGFLLPRNSS
ncbi:MAG: transposase [Bdellovibrionales bacterium]|nr:transposase [Bdellovibrionales bacterium]